MNYTLVVLDVQVYFEAASSFKLISNCKREIRKAINNKAPILLVEYINCGRTSDEILEVLSKYDNKFIVIKTTDDGSFKILEAIAHFHLPNKIRLIGVNTNACVYATAKGLVKKSCEVNVIADACNSINLKFHNIGLNKLRKCSGVRVSHEGL